MSKRKGLSKGKRFNVFKRDRFTCQYCGRTPPTVVLEVDHIIPVAGGGDDEETKLITACTDCNDGKAAKPLGKTPRSIDETLAEQVERREQLEAYNGFLMEARERDDQTASDIGNYWFSQLEGKKSRYTFSGERFQSIKTFLKRLPAAEIYDAVDIALSRVTASFRSDYKAWKYFCGVCWKKIKDRSGGQP